MTTSGGFFKKILGGGKIELIRASFWFHYRILHSTHTRTTIRWVYLLIMISKTIPVSTATVERSFSAMNRILSWARSSLDSTRASDSMTISLNRDFAKAINLDNVLER